MLRELDSILPGLEESYDNRDGIEDKEGSVETCEGLVCLGFIGIIGWDKNSIVVEIATLVSATGGEVRGCISAWVIFADPSESHNVVDKQNQDLNSDST